MVKAESLSCEEYQDPADGESQHRKRQIMEGRERNTALLAHIIGGIVAQNRKLVAPEAIPQLVFRGLLGELARRSGELDLAVYPTRDRGYAKYIVYNHKEEGIPVFSFTLIVLAPGQKTAKHSHRVDCAPICIAGAIEETLYRELPARPGEQLGTLEVLRKSLYRPFEGGYLVQDQPNVHCLQNNSDDVAMSLHLYVFDAAPDARGQMATSILHIYP